jgi:hypothetical protein
VEEAIPKLEEGQPVQDDIIDTTRIKRGITLGYPILYGKFLREFTNLHRLNNCI